MDVPPLAIVFMYSLSFGGIVFALSRRRGFAATIAWVLAMLLLPGVGALVYLLLADPRVKRERRKKRAAREKSRRVLAPTSGPQKNPLRHLSPMHRSILELATRVTDIPGTSGNTINLLTNNKDAFHCIETALENAKTFIWAEYYIVNNDSTGRRFLELLIAKAKEGVEVKLLYDAVGSNRIDRERVYALQVAGGQAAAFLPMSPFHRRWAVHLRNHRKVLVVDGEIGFTGGMNIGDEYSGSLSSSRRHRRPWRDTHLQIWGPAVDDLAQVFAEDWCFATDHSIVPPLRAIDGRSGSVVAVIPSGPDQDLNAHSLVYCSGIHSAISTCYLTSPYFIPDDSTLQALMSAALRGVDVRVLVPERSDIPLMTPAIRSYYPLLVRAGVRVFEYRPSMLHAKTMVVDQAFGVVGSANLDMRSFRLNFELGALIFDQDFAKSLEARFMEDLAASIEISKEAVEQRKLLTVLGEGTAQLLSPLL